MNTEKTITKTTGIKVAIIVLIVLALSLTAVFVFAGRGDHTEDPQETQGNVQQDATNDADPEVGGYTVIFKDYDGTVLDTQKVVHGKAAKAPADPTRAHFAFAGWDSDFENITSDLVVTATYTTKEFVISVDPVTVAKGAEEVTVNIRVYNNPGIMGAVLNVSVDDEMFAFVKSEKTEYPGLTLTASGPETTASPYTFMLDAQEISAEDQKDGTLFSITFQVKDAEAVGTYDVELSAQTDAVFDKDYKNPTVVLENGTITIA